MGTAPLRPHKTKNSPNGEGGGWKSDRPQSVPAVVLSNHIPEDKGTLRGARKTSC